jgi:hypothetical protein
MEKIITRIIFLRRFVIQVTSPLVAILNIWDGFEFLTRHYISPLYTSIHTISNCKGQKLKCILVGNHMTRPIYRYNRRTTTPSLHANHYAFQINLITALLNQEIL